LDIGQRATTAAGLYRSIQVMCQCSNFKNMLMFNRLRMLRCNTITKGGAPSKGKSLKIVPRISLPNI
jgi:hypothetical protein